MSGVRAESIIPWADDLYVDVREPWERAAGHLRWSINIPLWDIHTWSHSLPKDRRIAVYCRSGSRSWVARGILSAAGYDVYNAGGIIYGIHDIPIVQ